MADQAQLFINAQAAAQLAVLPTFSNVFKDDNFTSSQWLQKVLNHKIEAAWTDKQTVTHVRNAFRGDLMDWFDSLHFLGIDTTVWENIRSAFETDFKAAPSVTSNVNKTYKNLNLNEQQRKEYQGYHHDIHNCNIQNCQNCQDKNEKDIDAQEEPLFYFTCKPCSSTILLEIEQLGEHPDTFCDCENDPTQDAVTIQFTCDPCQTQHDIDHSQIYQMDSWEISNFLNEICQEHQEQTKLTQGEPPFHFTCNSCFSTILLEIDQLGNHPNTFCQCDNEGTPEAVTIQFDCNSCQTQHDIDHYLIYQMDSWDVSHFLDEICQMHQEQIKQTQGEPPFHFNCNSCSAKILLEIEQLGEHPDTFCDCENDPTQDAVTIQFDCNSCQTQHDIDHSQIYQMDSWDVSDFLDEICQEHQKQVQRGQNSNEDHLIEETQGEPPFHFTCNSCSSTILLEIDQLGNHPNTFCHCENEDTPEAVKIQFDCDSCQTQHNIDHYQIYQMDSWDISNFVDEICQVHQEQFQSGQNTNDDYPTEQKHDTEEKHIEPSFHFTCSSCSSEILLEIDQLGNHPDTFCDCENEDTPEVVTIQFDCESCQTQHDIDHSQIYQMDSWDISNLLNKICQEHQELEIAQIFNNSFQEDQKQSSCPVLTDILQLSQINSNQQSIQNVHPEHSNRDKNFKHKEQTDLNTVSSSKVQHYPVKNHQINSGHTNNSIRKIQLPQDSSFQQGMKNVNQEHSNGGDYLRQRGKADLNWASSNLSLHYSVNNGQNIFQLSKDISKQQGMQNLGQGHSCEKDKLKQKIEKNVNLSNQHSITNMSQEYSSGKEENLRNRFDPNLNPSSSNQAQYGSSNQQGLQLLLQNSNQQAIQNFGQMQSHVGDKLKKRDDTDLIMASSSQYFSNQQSITNLSQHHSNDRDNFKQKNKTDLNTASTHQAQQYLVQNGQHALQIFQNLSKQQGKTNLNQAHSSSGDNLKQSDEKDLKQASYHISLHQPDQPGISSQNTLQLSQHNANQQGIQNISPEHSKGGNNLKQRDDTDISTVSLTHTKQYTISNGHIKLDHISRSASPLQIISNQQGMTDLSPKHSSSGDNFKPREDADINMVSLTHMEQYTISNGQINLGHISKSASPLQIISNQQSMTNLSTKHLSSGDNLKQRDDRDLNSASLSQTKQYPVRGGQINLGHNSRCFSPTQHVQISSNQQGMTNFSSMHSSNGDNPKQRDDTDINTVGSKQAKQYTLSEVQIKLSHISTSPNPLQIISNQLGTQNLNSNHSSSRDNLKQMEDTDINTTSLSQYSIRGGHINLDHNSTCFNPLQLSKFSSNQQGINNLSPKHSSKGNNLKQRDDKSINTVSLTQTKQSKLSPEHSSVGDNPKQKNDTDINTASLSQTKQYSVSDDQIDWDHNSTCSTSLQLSQISSNQQSINNLNLQHSNGLEDLKQRDPNHSNGGDSQLNLGSNSTFCPRKPQLPQISSNQQCTSNSNPKHSRGRDNLKQRDVADLSTASLSQIKQYSVNTCQIKLAYNSTCTSSLRFSQISSNQQVIKNLNSELSNLQGIQNLSPKHSSGQSNLKKRNINYLNQSRLCQTKFFDLVRNGQPNAVHNFAFTSTLQIPSRKPNPAVLYKNLT